MEIEHFIRNADAAIKRLSDQMEDLVGRNRLKYDSTVVEIFQGKIDLLRALGYAPARVSKLQARIEEIREEVRKEAA